MPSHLPHDFETVAQSDRSRTILADRLVGTGEPTAVALGRKLSLCRAGHRCGSSACPSCGRLFRSSYLMMSLSKLRPLAWNPWTAASIVPEGCLFPPGGLAQFDLRTFRRLVQRRLERSLPKYVGAVCGIDISFNTETNHAVGWQVQVYLVIFAERTKALKKLIRDAFPPEPSALRPYRFRAGSDLVAALSYLHKNRFVRRSGYQTGDGRRTWHYPLKAPQDVEAALCMSTWKLGDRLILKGVRRNGRHWELIVPAEPIWPDPPQSYYDELADLLAR